MAVFATKVYAAHPDRDRVVRRSGASTINYDLARVEAEQRLEDEAGFDPNDDDLEVGVDEHRRIEF